MQHRPTLLVLAAGMATRYGSLKQIDSFGPHGETIIDYSVYDALKAGFGRVVFVIRESIEEAFKAAMRRRFPDEVQIAYVAQELDMLPAGFEVPVGRTKPWGTGHAVWVAASEIKGPFAVINGDDFYGYESFKLAADFLQNSTDESEYGLVAFKVENTLSEYGAVSRGVCGFSEDAYLTSLTEQTHIIRTPAGIAVQDPGAEARLLNEGELVSMNLMAFKPSVLPYFEAGFKEFLQKNSANLKAEFYLPDVVNAVVQSGDARVKVLHTPEKWFGVTYPDDKATAIQRLENLIQAGVYPENLWGKIPSPSI
ncbi:nucleotidyltransferase [Pontibacter sp. 172403-2]|uniref:sugar phosphate nucleotidyltransferase n=1 Tax=Pontibacter rufus TaxID=2791028 RepID=UPI0018AF5A2D|nr:sugar phosphate nucleotidyltransferase [Pontibacter sp. 172403-2]MBF9255698.1 nucleotidyltransferase [Pontibacter sp. 172403-2]